MTVLMNMEMHLFEKILKKICLEYFEIFNKSSFETALKNRKENFLRDKCRSMYFLGVLSNLLT